MNCLIDFIGILGCGQSAPDSGLYVNSLPGISLESIDNIANSEQVTYASVWNDVQQRAQARFKTRVLSAFRKRFTDSVTVSGVKQTFDLGREIDIDTVTNASAQLRGFYIDLEPNNGNVLNPKIVGSNLRQINLQSVSIYMLAAVTATIYIIDVDANKILDTLTLDSGDVTVDAFNLINVNESYNCNRLLVAYNATAIDSVSQDWYSAFIGLEVSGVSTVSTSDYTVTDTDDTFGLTGIFTVGCAFDNIVCNNKSHFAAAWLYILGEELMIERLFSERVNWITNDKEQAEKLKNYFSLQFDDELQSAIDGISINMQDSCIECAEAYQTREARL